MELIKAIALICQLSSGALDYSSVQKEQLWCQQSYIHCVRVNVAKGDLTESEALEKCIMEKR